MRLQIKILFLSFVVTFGVFSLESVLELRQIQENIILKLSVNNANNCIDNVIFKAVGNSRFTKFRKLKGRFRVIKDFIVLKRNIKSEVFRYYTVCDRKVDRIQVKSKVYTINYKLIVPVPVLRNIYLGLNNKPIIYWNPASITGSKDLLTVNLYKKIGPIGRFRKLNRQPIRGNKFVDNQRNNKQRVFYRAQFIRNGVAGDMSNLVSYKAGKKVKLLVPSTNASNLRIEYVNSYSILTWMGAGNKKNKYEVYSRVVGDKWKNLGKVPCCKYYHLGLSLQTKYEYKIKSKNSKNKIVESKSISLTTPYPKPSSVSNLQYNSRGNSKVVYWDGFSEANLDGFYVYTSKDKKKWRRSIKILATKFSYKLTKQDSKQNYIFVRSVNKFKQLSKPSKIIRIKNDY